MMKKFFPSIIFLLFLFCMLPKANKTSNLPILYCKNSSFNVGDVNAKKKVISHIFTIENKGSGKLIITKVIPTCGCTKYEISKKELNMGETSVITINVNISDKFGEFEDGLHIQTNDPEHKSLYLLIKGNVIVDYLIYPEVIYFGRFHQSEYKNQKELFNLRIFSKSIKGIKSIKIDNPLLGYSVKYDKKNSIYTIFVFFKNKPPLGYYEGFINVLLDSKEKIEKKVAYSYEVTPKIKVRPEGINLSTLKSNYPHITFFYIYFNKPFKILNVLTPDKFSYELEKIKSKNKICLYRLKLILNDENFIPKWDKKDILIRTSYEKDPLINIEIINDLKK